MLKNEILSRKVDQIACDHDMRIECTFNCRRPGKAGFRLPLLMEHIMWHHNKVPFNHYCKTDGCKAEFFGTIDAVAHAKDGHEVVSHDVQRTIKDFWKEGHDRFTKQWQWEHAYFLHGKMVAEHLIEQLLGEGYLQLGPRCRREEQNLVYTPNGLDGMEAERSQRIGRAAQASLEAALMENSGGTGNCLGGYNRRRSFTSEYSQDGYCPRTPVYDNDSVNPVFKPSNNGSEGTFVKSLTPRDRDRAPRGGRGCRSARQYDEVPSNRYAIAGGGVRNNCSDRGRWTHRGGRRGGRGGDYGKRNGKNTWSDTFSTAAIDNDFANRNYGTPTKRLVSSSSTINSAKRCAHSYSRSVSEKEDGEVDSENGASRQRSERSWSGSRSDEDDGPSTVLNKMPDKKPSVGCKEEMAEARVSRERSYSRSDSD